VIVTRGKSLDAPLGELRKANTVELPRAHQPEISQSVGDRQIREATKPALLTNTNESNALKSYGR